MGMLLGSRRALVGKGRRIAPPCWFLTFDGTDDILSLGVPLVITPPYTIAFWVKRHTAGHRDGILGINGGALDWIYYRSSNDLTYRHNGPISASAVDATLLWQHIAITVPVAPATVTIYRNGVDVTAVANTAIGARTWDRIGMIYDGSFNRYLDGDWGAMGVCPAILNVPALWAAGAFRGPLDPSVFLDACWNGRLEGGAGLSFLDEAAGGHDGAFKGPGEPAWGGLMSVGGPPGWSD